MELGLSGKRALVAAASAGLGYAIAHGLAAEGCRVSIAARSEDRLLAAVDRIALDTGSEVHHRVADVTNDEGLQGWIEDAAERWGGIDLVVPNAGGPPAGTFAELEGAQWDDAYRLTLRSAVQTARFAKPHLARGGAMLYLTSSSVKEPPKILVLSSVFRAGVAALAKTLAVEWATDGIRVNHLIPGRIATERVAQLDDRMADLRGITSGEVREEYAGLIPVGRYGQPEEFAAAAVFLLSDAASYITGATLQVDGGMLRSVM